MCHVLKGLNYTKFWNYLVKKKNVCQYVVRQKD